MKIKVFLVGDFPEDDKTYGGVQGVLMNLTNELIHRPNIELILVSLTEKSAFENFDGRCRTYKLNFRASIFKARAKFDSIYASEKPDIIHIQGVVPGALLFKKKYRKSFVVTQHAVLSEERLWQVSIKRKLLFRFKEFVENYYFKKIENIIFISEYNKNLYLSNFQKAINSKLIPNPVNTIFFEGDKTIVDQKQNEMYFVGEVKKRKGLHVLLKAIATLKQNGLNSKLHVIGGFKELRYEKEIKAMIRSFDIEEEIIFCGWKNQQEILEYIPSIPVFVLPSFQETLPLSIAEALCHGKIVVATDKCGIPEMIEDEKSGYLFQPGDSEGLANKLQTVFSTENEHISKNAIAVSERYNPKNVVDETIEFYKSIIDSK
jgi:glycosyltransferase involved in cell wall biosynthesis